MTKIPPPLRPRTRDMVPWLPRDRSLDRMLIVFAWALAVGAWLIVAGVLMGWLN